MNFEPHGQYQILRKGEIFVLRFRDSWNLECSKAFHQDFRQALNDSGLRRFGVISNLSGLVGGSPEAIDYFRVIRSWAQENGQIARALILDGILSKYSIEKVDKSGQTAAMPIRRVADEDEGFSWLRSLRLSDR